MNDLQRPPTDQNLLANSKLALFDYMRQLASQVIDVGVPPSTVPPSQIVEQTLFVYTTEGYVAIPKQGNVNRVIGKELKIEEGAFCPISFRSAREVLITLQTFVSQLPS